MLLLVGQHIRNLRRKIERKRREKPKEKTHGKEVEPAVCISLSVDGP